jgi:uncharacterized repeat protein (TIGR03803 family)
MTMQSAHPLRGGCRTRRRLGARVAWLALLALASSAGAQTFTTLYTFCGNCGTPAFPDAGLVQGTDGNLYGTTADGGADNAGTVFVLPPGGTPALLFAFPCNTEACKYGAQPTSALVQAPNGRFYGSTFSTPSNSDGGVYSITVHGTPAVVYDFQSGLGGSGNAPLTVVGNGVLYGTTTSGGAYGEGTAFSLSSAGVLTTLHSFCPVAGCADGMSPTAGLIEGTNGDFYGTTQLGGAASSAGTIFRLTPAGVLTTLHTFCEQAGCPDGAYPFALLQASNGDFYGTTESGGANGFGTVWRLTARGAFETLYSFCAKGGCADGSAPQQVLLEGSDGNLYGATAGGGTFACGTLYQLTPAGALTTLHSFSLDVDGCLPVGLVQHTNGTFYGTTHEAAPVVEGGTIFSLSMGLGPFVATQSSQGAVGATVRILGDDLTGTTAVTFNGKRATFTVVSATEITATVPARASSGPVTVTTPAGVLTSNLPFTVR